MLMNDYLLYGIVALIVIIVLAIVFTYIIKNRHPKQIKAGDSLEDLKTLGASGIVQTTNKVSAIFGKYSKEISNMINNR